MPAEYASAYKKLAPLYDTPFAEIRKRHIQNVIDNLNVGHSSNYITNRIYTHKTIRQLIDAINLI